MFLVRSIQKRETVKWVRALNTNPSHFVPLPFLTHEEFTGLAIIHRGFAYLFRVREKEEYDDDIVECGSKQDQLIFGRTKIYVVLGSMSVRRTCLRGGQGVRYLSQPEITAKKGSVIGRNGGKRARRRKRREDDLMSPWNFRKMLPS